MTEKTGHANPDHTESAPEMSLPAPAQTASQSSAHSILVVGPAWVGDAVMAQSLLRVLRQRHPDVAIDVLAPGWTRPLLERMPEVRHAIDIPVGHGELGLRIRLGLGRALRERRYAQAIVLPNSLKSALTPFWAKIPRRTGFLGELRWGLLNDVRPLDKTRLARMVERFVALGLEPGAALPSALPQPCLRVEPTRFAAACERLGLATPTTPLLALCPGAEYGPAKRWPAAHFARLARAKHEDGWAVWIFGSEKDAGLGREINRHAGGLCVDLTGKTRLADAVDLLSAASVVVSNDSGLMHVAAALGRRLVVIYGSSTPAFTPPLSSRATTVSLGLPCSPCFQRDCPLGHTDCLRTLSPRQVLAAMETLPP